MENIKLKNLAGLFRDTRTRTIIIFTGVILVIGIIVGAVRLTKSTGGPNTGAQVSSAPTIQSIPGGFGGPAPNPEYARLQERQNALQAKIAEQQGGSAIPTIVKAENFGQAKKEATKEGVCCNPCPCPGAGGGTSGVGNLPLQPSSLIPGTLVYDSQGHIIGTVGADGKVRDSTGKIVGTVGPDGLVRDIKGNVIGSAAVVASGAPVFDSQGRLIGTVGSDGKVRDANGKIVGTVDSDGTVRDLTGNVIGKAASFTSGSPVYDSQGNLLGTVGADGKVRDASGKIIGTVDADGTVRDSTGKVIGKVKPKASTIPGAPVYDAQGKLLGTVGADGKVRDSNGNIIGTVDSDGIVRDASGKVIGKTGPTMSGTPVYDAQGHLIGIAGSDGKVRDVNGKIIGTVGLDGSVRDPDGNIIGSTNPTGGAIAGGTAGGVAASAAGLTNASIPGLQTQTQNTALQDILKRQTAQISEQKADQLRQQLQAAIATQTNQLLGAWASPVQQYVAGNPVEANKGGPGGSGGSQGSAETGTPSIKAGTIMYATLMTSVNSDEPGPVLATIVDGKFKGAKLIGGLTNQGQKVLLSFNLLNMPGISKSIPINGVAIDPSTARTAFSSYTDNHYVLRYGTLFAASFIQGYGQAFQTSGQSVISNGLQTQTVNPDLSPGGKFMTALGNVGTKMQSAMGDTFNTPPTVYVNSGSAMGILFLADVPPLPQ